MTADKDEKLRALASNARQRGWWDAYATLPGDYTTYIALESEASSLRTYDALVVNGLLQTEEYARQVIRAGLMNTAPPGEVDRRVEARLLRQRILTRAEPLSLWSIVDENALRRMVGGPKVMHGQYQRLIELAESPNITLQVLPHDAGAHSGLAGMFYVMEFREPYDPDVVYVETAVSALWVEDDTQVHRYTLIYEQKPSTPTRRWCCSPGWQNSNPEAEGGRVCATSN